MAGDSLADRTYAHLERRLEIADSYDIGRFVGRTVFIGVSRQRCRYQHRHRKTLLQLHNLVVNATRLRYDHESSPPQGMRRSAFSLPEEIVGLVRSFLPSGSGRGAAIDVVNVAAARRVGTSKRCSGRNHCILCEKLITAVVLGRQLYLGPYLDCSADAFYIVASTAMNSARFISSKEAVMTLLHGEFVRHWEMLLAVIGLVSLALLDAGVLPSSLTLACSSCEHVSLAPNEVSIAGMVFWVDQVSVSMDLLESEVHGEHPHGRLRSTGKLVPRAVAVEALRQLANSVAQLLAIARTVLRLNRWGIDLLAVAETKWSSRDVDGMIEMLGAFPEGVPHEAIVAFKYSLSL